MKKIRTLSFFLWLCLLFSLVSPSALALDAPAVSAQSWIIVDMKTGEVIDEFNADEQRSPASLTKIMTGLLAVEAVDRGDVAMEDRVTAGFDCQNGMDSSSSNAGIVAGEEMSFQDFFYCAMVVSANEACNVLGSRIAGSIGGFVDMMNRRAEELGLEKTHFVDPNGLSYDNLSSARELSVILREALSHEEFKTAFETSYYTVPATNYNNERSLKSTDALTTPDSYYSQYGDYTYKNAKGAKTGFTRRAGYCLASVAEKDDLEVLIVVLGCPGPLSGDSQEPENFLDTIRLYEWVFSNFSYQQVLSSTELIRRVTVEQAEGDGVVNLRCPVDLTLLLPSDAPPESRELDVTIYEERLQAPIPANTVLGSMSMRIDGKSYGPYDLVNPNEVKMAKSEFIKEKVDDFFLTREVIITIVVLGLILLLYVALVLRYRALRRKHLREKRRVEKRRKAAIKAREAQQQAQDAVEPTLRFTVVDRGDQDADAIDLARFFDEPAPEAEAEEEKTPAEPPAEP